MVGKEIKKCFRRNHLGWKPEVDKFCQMEIEEVQQSYTNWGHPDDCCSKALTTVKVY